jgi:Na+/H+ antiporter NhaD/arsenite permease-like protein
MTRKVLLFSIGLLFVVAVPVFADGYAATAALSEAVHLGEQLPIWSVIPFIGILLSIALLPLLAPKFWHRHFVEVSAFWAIVFVFPFVLIYGGLALQEIAQVALDYFSFLTLLAALFIISGGIHLSGDIEAKPQTNALFLLIGAVLANFIGTTGASMLLIRTVLSTNRERQNTRHIPIFFIFLVSNIGGALLPIGDPPLFLGYLVGVPFFWTLRLFPLWIFTVALVLLVFFVMDARAYRNEPTYAVRWDKAAIQPLRLVGKINFVWLLGVLLAAILLPLPFKEAVMWLMALLSWVTTQREIRRRNEFTWHPIVEVAVLFAGIFATMIPCLLILKARGGELGITQPWQFFWATGMLSSFLDNAPTYLTYLSLGQGVTTALALPAEIVLRDGRIAEMYLMAVSAGAVFMGANTYIGNAPNFMVRAIAQERGIRMPSFFGYMAYSICILVPIFVAVTLVFFR